MRNFNKVFEGARGVAMAASVGNLLQGWDSSSIAGALLYIKPEFKLEENPTLEGLMVASTLVAAIASTVIAGPVSDRLGRRAVLAMASLVFTLGGAVMVWSPTVYVLVCGRLLTGAGIGFAATIAPVLIAESAPTSVRGQLATLPQLIGSAGQFLAYVVVFGLSLSPRPNWRLMLGILVVPSIFYLLLCVSFLPESPRWLVSKGRMSEAKSVLQRLYLKEDVTAELALLVEGLGVGVDTSFEEYILKPTTAQMVVPEELYHHGVGAPLAKLDEYYSLPEEGEGVVLLYEPEHSVSWIAKPVFLHAEDRSSGFLSGSRARSLAGSGMSLLTDPTVSMLGNIQNNLDSLADQLLHAHNASAMGEGDFFNVFEPHWDEESPPSPHPAYRDSDATLSTPLLEQEEQEEEEEQEQEQEQEEKSSTRLALHEGTTSMSHGASASSMDIPRGLKKTASDLSRASRLSVMTGGGGGPHPHVLGSVTDIFGSTANMDGAWQLAWQWEQQQQQQQQQGGGENHHPHHESQFKRVFLLPENPDHTLHAGLFEEIEGVPAAAFVSQPALRASEILGEEPSGPAMVHPSETAVPGPLWSELKDIGVKRALVVGVGLQVLQQFSGINAVLYYTPQILEGSGVDVILSRLGLSTSSASLLASGIVSLLTLPCIFLAMRLMDRSGRRYLLLMTLPILVVALMVLVATEMIIPAGVGAAILSVVCLAIFTCSFVTGFGPIPNIMCSEIFPTRVRGVCIGLCSATMWLSNVVVSDSFPMLSKSIGLAGAFCVFAIVSIISWAFVFLKVPETKGVPLEVISEIFAYKPSSSLEATLKGH